MPDEIATPPPAPDAPKAPETAEAPKAEPEKKEPSLASRFAALSKKEKGLVLKAQDVKAREEALAEKLARADAYEKRKSSAKENPLAVLEELGLSYDELTAFVLNDKKQTPDLGVRAVKEEIAKLRAEQAEKEQKAAEAEKVRLEAEQRRVIEDFNASCIAFVKANATDYEFIHLADAFSAVPELVAQTFAKSQRVLTAKEAADLVEKHLEERLETISKTSKKLAAKAAPQAEGADKRIDPAPAKPQPALTTQRLTATTPASTAKAGDRYSRAMAAMDAAHK